MVARKRNPKDTDLPANGVVMPSPAANIHRDPATVRQLLWDVAAINIHLGEIDKIWASRLGVSEPQWLILKAIEDLDRGDGVSGIEVSAKLHIYPAFVTNQTKSLEKSGFLRRTVSATDGRVVLMFLTAKTRREMDKLAVNRREADRAIFASLNDETLRDITDKLNRIRKDAERIAGILLVESKSE